MNVSSDSSTSANPGKRTAPQSGESSADARHSAETACAHCGLPCVPRPITDQGKSFCCLGCATVHELLTEHGLEEFYHLAPNAGVRVARRPEEEQFRYLDQPEVRAQLVEFEDDRVTRITFRVPSIHCIACVWLLENLYRFNPGINSSQVNFPRKELTLSLATGKVDLSEVVTLITALGYEPELRLSSLGGQQSKPAANPLWLRLGVAGFAFGNVMLFSLPAYLGLDRFSEPVFQKVFAGINLLLGTLVITVSARGYWRSALQSLRQRLLNIDVPIAMGMLALFAQSAYEVLSRTGDGYFDSLTGLVFFLLLGKAFQQKSYDQLSFDRDYKAFFPLAVTRRSTGSEEERVTLSDLRVGDRLLLRNGELIPADSRLLSDEAAVDYSFVTGESSQVRKTRGAQLYAGGRLTGGTIEAETLKPVSQSYLTSLWNQDVFNKNKPNTLKNLTDSYSQYFTQAVVAIALLAGLFWLARDASRALTAFTAVLIVACPCALALAAPFALGTAQRLLASQGVFLKSQEILESIARINLIVFDKTGTLTEPGTDRAVIRGTYLSDAERSRIYSVCRHSTHPVAARVEQSLAGAVEQPVTEFTEKLGAGMEGRVGNRTVRIGSSAWLKEKNIIVPKPDTPGLGAHVAIDGEYRGCFMISDRIRPDAADLLLRLRNRFSLALLSGDRDGTRERFQAMFPPAASLRFQQSPSDKLSFVRQQQKSGRRILMVGDGLNDAGALQQSDVGIAVVESLSAFSPASDVIMSAHALPRLDSLLQFARRTLLVVRVSLAVSALYNLVGISIAAAGLLSPIICAILMPLSSITVVALAAGWTGWYGNRMGLRANTVPSTEKTDPAGPGLTSLVVNRGTAPAS